MKTFTNWKEWAMNRGRVRNTVTGDVGNLVDHNKRYNTAKVFLGYELIGMAKLPKFVTWILSETQPESNEVPVSNT